jgi:putative transcriptional regulator
MTIMDPGRGRLNNTLKQQRAERNLTQEQVAELVGVTRKTINTIERGRFVPSTVLALKLAGVFGVPVEVLFQLPSHNPAGSKPDLTRRR